MERHLEGPLDSSSKKGIRAGAEGGVRTGYGPDFQCMCSEVMCAMSLLAREPCSSSVSAGMSAGIGHRASVEAFVPE